jgi:hypothetical protein
VINTLSNKEIQIMKTATRKIVSKEIQQDADVYVGSYGEVWFQEGSSLLRFGNTVTPGGVLLDPSVSSGTTTFDQVSILGVLSIEQGVHERTQSITAATGVITHDCSLGHIFYHTAATSTWTANLTNLALLPTYATSITMVISQGTTGYIPVTVQIDGVAQTILWQGGGDVPTPSSSRVDVVTFSIINNSGTFVVLGQLTGF